MWPVKSVLTYLYGGAGGVGCGVRCTPAIAVCTAEGKGTAVVTGAIHEIAVPVGTGLGTADTVGVTNTLAPSMRGMNNLCTGIILMAFCVS